MKRLGQPNAVVVILRQRDEYDGAAELQRKRLEVHESHGDLDEIASATWGLARIDLVRQDYASALPRLVTSFNLLIHLRRPDGMAVVGHTLGQILVIAGLSDEARPVLELSLAAARKVDMTDYVQAISHLLANLSEQGKTT
ncbi:hypothetical protein [Micromonospora sp. DT229]|uniref:hypothetical protein n=1 Tax=Micromonospora sp. DT229 TaxID=3393430 RepID=UPI003CEF3107